MQTYHVFCVLDTVEYQDSNGKQMNMRTSFNLRSRSKAC